jgi:hypothetical protein
LLDYCLRGFTTIPLRTTSDVLLETVPLQIDDQDPLLHGSQTESMAKTNNMKTNSKILCRKCECTVCMLYCICTTRTQ